MRRGGVSRRLAQWNPEVVCLETCSRNELVVYRGKVALLLAQGGVLGPDVPRFKSALLMELLVPFTCCHFSRQTECINVTVFCNLSLLMMTLVLVEETSI